MIQSVAAKRSEADDLLERARWRVDLVCSSDKLRQKLNEFTVFFAESDLSFYEATDILRS